MKYDVFQVLGMLLLAVCVQGLVRLLIDDSERGVLGGLPGGFVPLLLTYAALTAVGVLLAGWAHTRAKALGRR
ncbi:hypothetical protein ABZ214_22555 [Streptomyces iakyrus]|jgi:hypothetical protein|uniref:hypothetical protein n=1 Tax=Streptomyces iakyrus TaxID=68219 RepID=UPI0005263EFE|nr:hypothetical protein [Streptomyces iakyrus]